MVWLQIIELVDGVLGNAWPASVFWHLPIRKLARYIVELGGGSALTVTHDGGSRFGVWDERDQQYHRAVIHSACVPYST